MLGKIKLLLGRGLLMGLLLISCGSGPAQAEETVTSEGPATIILDSIKEYYEAVEFDHALHIEFAENDCAKCHHHTIGTPSTGTGNCILCHKKEATAKIIACRGCHLSDPYSPEGLKVSAERGEVYHKDKPSLKGAYHQFCISCHEEVDGPYTCVGCHERTDKGDAFFYSGKYAPVPTGTAHH